MHNRPFITDGCSGGMSAGWKIIIKLVNKILNKKYSEELPWHNCCVEHDRKYWEGGGTPLDRERADRELAKCVAQRGYPTFGFIMYLAVQIGGHPKLPFPWRWGYKYKYPYGGYIKN